MKVLVISDIHDNLENLKSVLSFARDNNINILLCTGDVTNFDTLSFLSKNFDGDTHLVRGNADSFDDKEAESFDNINFYGKIGRFKLGDYKVGMCHEPYLIDKVLEEASDLVFYGHTHKPWIEKKGNAQIINPGTLGGMFGKATFALWEVEDGKLELKLVQ